MKAKLAILTILGVGLALAWAEDTGRPATKPSAEAKIADAIKAIDAAKKSLQGDDKKAALAELDRARDILAAIQGGGKVARKFANRKCPIMLAIIAPESVKDDQVREFKGEKIGFCCSPCVTAWDKLTDDEKAQKLKAAENEK